MGSRCRCLGPDAPHGQRGLLKFDATPLFPERIAYTVPYKLSGAEAQLTKSHDYVREEFNRARRSRTINGQEQWFCTDHSPARLASSPEAIYQSLRRRRERLESRLRELELLQRGSEAASFWLVQRCSMTKMWKTWRMPQTMKLHPQRRSSRSGYRSTTIAELKAEIELSSAWRVSPSLCVKAERQKVARTF